MITETTKEKSGGLAYEVILKPASTESPARPPSPPKNGRPLSQVDIEKKLAEAEKRRQVSVLGCVLFCSVLFSVLLTSG